MWIITSLKRKEVLAPTQVDLVATVLSKTSPKDKCWFHSRAPESSAHRDIVDQELEGVESQCSPGSGFVWEGDRRMVVVAQQRG
jgi:hypothetical protein